MTDREQIDSLVKKAYDYFNEIMELKQENNALKQRVAELENASKPKRKFRAMTNSEFWRTYVSGKNFCRRNCSLCRQIDICELAQNWNSISKKPYKTKDGKYIMIEVKE